MNRSRNGDEFWGGQSVLLGRRVFADDAENVTAKCGM
jgi:hypothetical protein